VVRISPNASAGAGGKARLAERGPADEHEDGVEGQDLPARPPDQPVRRRAYRGIVWVELCGCMGIVWVGCVLLLRMGGVVVYWYGGSIGGLRHAIKRPLRHKRYAAWSMHQAVPHSRQEWHASTPRGSTPGSRRGRCRHAPRRSRGCLPGSFQTTGEPL
jgi:hypothetical protein